MSKLIKQVKFRLKTHGNADALSLALVEETGWQCVVKTSDWVQPGEVVSDDPQALPAREGLYIGIDALLDPARTEFAFLKDKATKKFPDGRPGHRIKTVRLRARLSQGLLIRIEPWMRAYTLESGALDLDAINAHLGVERYEPPIPPDLRGEMVRSPGEFHRYTGIENGKNVPTMFEPGDAVLVTEKIHGTNWRVGLVHEGLDSGPGYFVGSHNTAKLVEGGTTLYAVMARTYLPEEKLREIAAEFPFSQHFIVYGEAYGHKVQDLNYGCKANERKVALFDVLIDHVWQPWDVVSKIAHLLGLETVPLLYAGVYDAAEIAALRDGKSTLPGAAHVREGVVVKAVPESRVTIRDSFGELVYEGRKMCKLISDDYLERRDAKDGH